MTALCLLASRELGLSLVDQEMREHRGQMKFAPDVPGEMEYTTMAIEEFSETEGRSCYRRRSQGTTNC
jgi:hypothetical protein